MYFQTICLLVPHPRIQQYCANDVKISFAQYFVESLNFHLITPTGMLESSFESFDQYAYWNPRSHIGNFRIHSRIPWFTLETKNLCSNLMIYTGISRYSLKSQVSYWNSTTHVRILGKLEYQDIHIGILGSTLDAHLLTKS